MSQSLKLRFLMDNENEDEDSIKSIQYLSEVLEKIGVCLSPDDEDNSLYQLTFDESIINKKLSRGAGATQKALKVNLTYQELYDKIELLSQKEVANELGISAPALSKRLKKHKELLAEGKTTNNEIVV